MDSIGFQLEDVLDMAIQMEEEAAEYYSFAAGNVTQTGPKILLHGLAAVEIQHRNALRDLKARLIGDRDKGDPAVVGVIEEFIASWLRSESDADNLAVVVETARSGELPRVLSLACEMENDAIAFYTGLRKYIADEAAEDMVGRIIKQEKQHASELQAALQSLSNN